MPKTFVVRIWQDGAGPVRGVVERVRTGAKEFFGDIEALGPLVRKMLEADASASSQKDTGRATSPGMERNVL